MTTQARDYEVRPNDSLWGIAERYSGSGANWRELYVLNAQTIAREQIRRTKEHHGGRLIFPGTRLAIPAGWSRWWTSQATRQGGDGSQPEARGS